MDYIRRTVVAEVYGKSTDFAGVPSELGCRRPAARKELPSVQCVDN